MIQELKQLVSIIKQHKKISIPIIAVIALVIISIPVAAITILGGNKNTNSSLDGWRQWQDGECKRKSTLNDFDYAVAEYDAADKANELGIAADVSTKEVPEVYVDGVLATPSEDNIRVEPYANCNGAKHTYYEVSISLPSTCTEKKVILKNSVYDLEADVSIYDSCKTADQLAAEQKAKADAEAQKQAEAARKKQEETDKQAKALAANPYSKLGTDKVQNYRAYTHYKLNGTTKPSLNQVKQYMVEIQRKGCDGPQTCNFFLWTSNDAYNGGKSDVMNGMANEVASRHKDTLTGYVNSGYAFYYYGSTGSAPGRMTIMDPDTGTYLDF